MTKRILLFIDSLGPGGAQRQLVGLACLLKRKEYEVKVVTYYKQDFYKSLLDKDDIAYECFDINSKLSILYLIRCIKHFKPNVLISFQTNPNSIACVASKLCRIKLIVSERNTHQSISLKDRIIFNLYRLADYIVPNSHSEAKFIKEHFHFLKDKVVTISNFVDLQKFKPCNMKESNTKRIIMTAASIMESKNTKKYLEACILAFERGLKATIIWYGINNVDTGTKETICYTHECIKLLKDSNMENKILLLRKRKDIECAYQEADIFCLPSLFEGTPNVICEAMASGLPIMASDVCDNSIFVREHQNGWLFNPMSIEQMANVLLVASNSSDDKIKQYGIESREIVEEKCSEQVFVEKYISLINSL